MQGKTKYEDIIRLSRPVSERHAPMSMSDRAAQFSPFAALTGYDAVIAETGRLTEGQVNLTESGQEEINAVIQCLKNLEEEHPGVKVTFFKPDERKKGGSYCEIIGTVRKIDELSGIIVLTNEIEIPFERILKLEKWHCMENECVLE